MLGAAHPNDELAAAVDELAGQIPASVAATAKLLTLASDTVRVALTDQCRSIDITRLRGAERCHVTVHSWWLKHRCVPARSYWFRRRTSLTRPGMVEHHLEQHYHDVAIAELGWLLAQPGQGPARRSSRSTTTDMQAWAIRSPARRGH